VSVGREGKSSVCAVLLAAGTSERFGAENKLLAEIDGAPLVRGVAENLVASRVAAVAVVTGCQAERIQDALAGLEVRFVTNPEFEKGLSSSLRHGVAAVGDDPSGAMVVLADMPGTLVSVVDALIEAFEKEDCKKIVFPVDPKGQQGNPVIWPRAFFGELQGLSGDRGAKKLIEQHRAHTLGIPVENKNTLRDIDTPADLAVWTETDRS